ncbi:hypothetical protein RhiirB3_175933 [Rhizophagus irregularis]|nr:hypothetical protein RhiirB3_175933 [Rhizophagus irregularis]
MMGCTLVWMVQRIDFLHNYEIHSKFYIFLSIAKILHSRAITTKSKHYKINYIKKTYFTPKKAISSEIKALCSRECTLRGEK